MALAEPLDPMPPDLALDGDEPFDDEAVERWALLSESVAAARPEDEWAEAAQAELAAHPVSVWRIDSIEKAEWAMRKVAQARAALEALEAKRDGWMTKIAGWFDKAAGPVRRRMLLMEARLEAYALEHRAADPKNNKTLRLPSGDVSTTGREGYVVVSDPEVFVAWAEASAPDLVVTETRPVAAEVKKAVTAVEVVEAVELELHLAQCGHTARVRVEPDAEAPKVAECLVCSAAGTMRKVGAVVSATDVVRLRFVTKDGEEVPGLDFKPSEVTAKVKPR